MADVTLFDDLPKVKICSKCGAKKSIDQFNLERGRPRAYCKTCHNKSVVEWQRKNVEKYNKRCENWRRRNGINAPTPALPKEIIAERKAVKNAAWRAANKERFDQMRKNWNEKNKPKIYENTRRQQARKRRAFPAWANKSAIVAIYERAIRLTAETGVKHEVDHIVPITSKYVCGLHVEHNLRVITKSENRRKSNKFQPI